MKNLSRIPIKNSINSIQAIAFMLFCTFYDSMQHNKAVVNVCQVEKQNNIDTILADNDTKWIIKVPGKINQSVSCSVDIQLRFSFL